MKVYILIYAVCNKEGQVLKTDKTWSEGYEGVQKFAKKFENLSELKKEIPEAIKAIELTKRGKGFEPYGNWIDL